MSTDSTTVTATTTQTAPLSSPSSSTPARTPLDSPPIENNERPSSSPSSIRSSLSWKSFSSRLSVSEKTSSQLGWAIALLSVVFTITTLSPAFKSEVAAQKALDLAEWTALKDYIEDCKAELADGVESQACTKALKAKLPPPPYVKFGAVERIKRDLGLEQDGELTYFTSSLVSFQLFLFLIAFASILSVLIYSRRFQKAQRRRPPISIFVSEDVKDYASTGSPAQSPTAITSQRYPPDSPTPLRRRTVRTHPIYRYANLEEALHHNDISEIRKRLVNGEDVTKHWPWLIYKLTITTIKTESDQAEFEKKLEIAQLCLDHGADVNALKGWNGQSALMIAIHFGKISVARLLLKNGAEVNYSSPDFGLTALHRCVRLAVIRSNTTPPSESLSLVQMLFAAGADPNQADQNGETALHKLLIDGWFDRNDGKKVARLVPIAKCLVDNGARIPVTIKEKYVLGNPLWDALISEGGLFDVPESVGPDGRSLR